MRNFIKLDLVGGNIVIFPVDEVVDVTGDCDTSEIQVVRNYDGRMIVYKVFVDTNVSDVHDSWLRGMDRMLQLLRTV